MKVTQSKVSRIGLTRSSYLVLKSGACASEIITKILYFKHSTNMEQKNSKITPLDTNSDKYTHRNIDSEEEDYILNVDSVN